MPFTDPVSSVSGRNSRASNVSGVTGSVRSHSRAMPHHETLASAGVLSMLKTSTDTGDIGALSFNSSRLPNMPRLAHQRVGLHRNKLSGGSQTAGAPHHRYAPSQTSKVSSSREWDSLSNPRRGSFTSMQSMPPSLPPVHIEKGASKMSALPTDRSGEGRSYSMTSALPNQQLPRHCSQASLRRHGNELQNHVTSRPTQLPPFVPPVPETRQAYAYPARFKRPGFRSPSPALSDTYVQAPPMRVGPNPTVGQRPLHSNSRPPPQIFNGDYGMEYMHEMRHLNTRPPSRVTSSSPVSGMSYSKAVQHPYRNPMAARSAPGIPVPLRPAQAHHPPAAQQAMSYDIPHHRPHGVGAAHLQRSGDPPCPPVVHLSHGPISAPSNWHHVQAPMTPTTAPMAHQMFHNAARMARQLPQRTDTPLTNISPPSSDPPSSGTAPSSSSPPTPKDQTTYHVAINPAFIDPALADLPESSSEPVMSHQYFQYADALEKDAPELEVEAAHPSVPPSGFVQRVRAMLESKASADLEAQKASQQPNVHEDANSGAVEHEIYELDNENASRFEVIEEFDAPVELPASPVKIAELGGSPIQPKRRITREMVKAELGPSDSLDYTNPLVGQGESANINAVFEDMRNCSRDEGMQRQNSKYENSKPISDLGSAVPKSPNHKYFHVSPNSNNRTSTKASSLSNSAVAAHPFIPADNTDMTDETQSKDPFVLDADTITLQHQKQNVESVDTHINELEKPMVTTSESQVLEAVSPIRPEEEVFRDSAVSPAQTHTLGFEETLQLAMEPGEEDTSSVHSSSVPKGVLSDEKNRKMPGSFPEESQPPPIPRTPKTHSKSVQLQPKTCLASSPSNNRLSLPPDLSIMGDSTLHASTFDTNTDEEVHFSVPQTTVTVSRPQIIAIPPSSSPDTPNDFISRQHKSSKSKRSSVTFADEIAPLKIGKNTEPHAGDPKVKDTSLYKGKSIMRQVTPREESAEPFRIARETTTDLRSPGANNLSSRFGSTHLPRLKEESVEDMSISDKRTTKTDVESNFPLPARIAAVKAMQERRLLESAEKAKARRAHRHPNRPLAETRDLPSLNFSRMDLIDKLNEALEVRPSRSMDAVRCREMSGIYCPSPQRPRSTEPLRERYMSFFSKPEEFSSFFAPLENKDTYEEEVIEVDESENQAIDNKPAVEIEPGTEDALAENASRPLSPEDLLNVASQVNRLSIPSVNGLSDRLSGLLPNLKRLQLDSILAGLYDGSEEVRCIGEAAHPDMISGSRISGFRTLAEQVDEISRNGRLSANAPVSKLLGELRDLALPSSLSADKMSAVCSIEEKQSYLSGSVSAPSDLGKESSRPPSALARSKSPPATANEVLGLLPPEMNPITRNSKRTLVSSAASSRPWIQDENYPWAGAKVDVDLSVPSEDTVQSPSTSKNGHLHNIKSLDHLVSDGPIEASKGIEMGSTSDNDPSSTLKNDQLNGSSADHLRKPSKKSVIGSLTKKMCLSHRTNLDSTTRMISSPTTDPSGHSSPRPHKPGERYPTSGLTPPAAFNLDEVRSFFSDESSEEKDQHAYLRKRLTQFKSRGRGSCPEQSRCQSRSHSLDRNTTYNAGQANMDRIGAISSANTYDGVGMGKTEFRIRRFGEKLRTLVAKGGELIRSWSQRSKTLRTESIRDDWLSDSLYSGV